MSIEEAKDNLLRLRAVCAGEIWVSRRNASCAVRVVDVQLNDVYFSKYSLHLNMYIQTYGSVGERRRLHEFLYSYVKQ